MSRPHGRNKRTGSGSVGVGRGRRVSGGGAVGGGSQGGRGGFSGGTRSGGRGAGSSGAGLLGLLALFAILPKKLRRVLLIVVAVVLVFSYLRGGFSGGSESYSPPQDSGSEGSLPLPGQSASLFDTSSLFEQEDIFGSGSGWSGGSPSGTTFTDKRGEKRGLITPGQHEEWVLLNIEIGRIIGGWLKQQAERKEDAKA